MKNIAIIMLIAIFFIADRYLKILALGRSLEPPIKLLGNFFLFDFTPNYYIAFSLPLHGWLLNLAIIAIILLIFIFVLKSIKRRESQIITVLLTLIIFGAISNILDRLSCGYVIDYLELKRFSSFNLADTMISFGAISLIILNLKKSKYA